VTRATRAWDRFWFAPESTAPLAVFRIGVGAVSFLWALSLIPDLRTFFSADGAVPGPPADPDPGFWGPLNTFSGYGAAVGALAALLVASLCLLAGYRSRIASAVVFLGVLSFERRTPSIFSCADGLLRNLAFFLMLAPSGVSLSADRLRTARDRFWEFPARAPWALRLVQLQISIIYLSAVWLKLHGEAWRDGTAVSYAMRLEDFQRFALPGELSNSLLFSTVATYWTISVELMIAVLVWNRAARPLVLALGVGLHLGLGANLRIGFFSETMLVAYLVFLSPAWTEAQLHAIRRRLVRNRGAAAFRTVSVAAARRGTRTPSGP
jgi:hypothetical protein